MKTATTVMNKNDIFYDYTNPFHYKCHVVYELNDEPEPQIVYKYYSKHKQWWHYGIISKYLFKLYMDSGSMSLTRKKND
jgi:hypothetical protein